MKKLFIPLFLLVFSSLAAAQFDLATLEQAPEQGFFEALASQQQPIDNEEAMPNSREGFRGMTGAAVYSGDYEYFIVAYNQNDIAHAQEVIQNNFIVEGYVFEHKYIVYTSVKDIEKFMQKEVLVDYEAYNTYERIVDKDVFLEEAFEQEYVISLFLSADEQMIASLLEELGADVLDVYDAVVLVALDDPKLVEDFIHLIGIQFIEPRRKVELFNDKANILSGTTNVRKQLGLYGAGQIIAITDGGLDTGKNDQSMHDDIEGRILKIMDVWDSTLNCPPLCSDKGVDYDSHGTHVTGSALGNGNKSNGLYAGAAPEAKVVFQSANGNQGKDFQPAWPENDKLWKPAYQLGAKTHSNSWGIRGSKGAYNIQAKELDEFIYKNKDYVNLFAAGNTAGYGTVTMPSTAKNSISVGAITTTRPDNQKGAEGPTADGRFKPDILAPGETAANVGIISTKSSAQKPYPIGCNGGPNSFYCEQVGTSMSTPHVAGLTAIIREYYIKQRGLPNPSAALIKATLLNGGEDIGNGLPSVTSGWGRANISRSLPSNPQDLEFFDESQGLTTGKKKVYKIYATAQQPLRLTLVWTDLPSLSWSNQQAPRLINNLDLVVIDPNNGQYNGNDITSPYDNDWDNLNNVERVEIKTPVQGMYTVEVRAKNVPQGSQDFALVTTHSSIDAKLTMQGKAQVARPVTFTIDDPAHPGATAYLLMGITGTSRGIPVGDGRTVPVNYDIAVFFSIVSPTALGLVNTPVKLDGSGKATVTWNVLPYPFLTSIPFDLTCIVMDTTQPHLSRSVKSICKPPLRVNVQP